PHAAGSLMRRDRRGAIIMPNDRPVAGAVLGQLRQPATVSWPGDDSDPHESDSRPRRRQPRARAPCRPVSRVPMPAGVGVWATARSLTQAGPGPDAYPQPTLAAGGDG